MNLGRLSACECVADIFHIPLELHLRLQQQELCPHGQHNGADAQRILTRFLEQVGRRQLHRWRGRQFLPLFKTMAISNCTEKTRSSAGSCNKAKGSQHTGLFGRPNLIGCRRHVCNVVFVPPVGMQGGRRKCRLDGERWGWAWPYFSLSSPSASSPWGESRRRNGQAVV